jgi:glyoxylate/succinic semialdehyde reductase
MPPPAAARSAARPGPASRLGGAAPRAPLAVHPRPGACVIAAAPPPQDRRPRRARTPPRPAAAAPSASSASAQPSTTPLTPPGSIAFLGLGIMGTAMATRLVRAGFKVTVWNRTPGATDALKAVGAAVAASPAAAVAAADITFAMLSDPAAALEVVAAAAPGLKPGAGYVDVSTVDPATACAVADTIHAAGGRFLEAPVSGSKGPAEQGTLIFLAAGDADLYARAAPALDAMGKARFLLDGSGTPGAGARMKLVVNALMGSMAAGLGEALAVSEAAGLDTAALIEVLGLGAIAAPLFAVKGPGMAAPAPRSYPPAFPLKHQAKDLRLYEALAAEVGVAVPIAAAAGARFARAEGELGRGDEDFAAVREAC